MKIILLQDIKGLGEKYDVKNVKDGYARNFLIPRGLVLIATESKIKTLSVKRLEEEKKEKGLKEKLEKLAEELARRKFEFSLKAGKKGEVFGSVSKNEIETLIYADMDPDLRGYARDLKVNLEKPIKILGEHQVEVNLGKEVETKIRIQISEEKS